MSIDYESPIYVTSPALPPIAEYVSEIEGIWDSRILTHQGPKYCELEEKVKDYLCASNAVLFANGHLALQVALWSMGLTKGEVITTPYTFASTTLAIVACGLTPVFCDIEPDSMTIDARKIEELITPETKAIVGVHVYGIPCDVERISEIAKKHSLKVIYDAAHAFGESYLDRGIAQFGDASMFSFHATKVFNTVEGGCVVFSDDALCKEARAWRQVGMGDDGAVAHVGTNAKMTEFHAAMGLCNIRHIDECIEKRKMCFLEYVRLLSKKPGLKLIVYPEDLEPNYAYFPVLIDEDIFGESRDEVATRLAKHNIFARKYFYPLTSDFECFKGLFPIQETPIARDTADRVLCLPLYADLSVCDVQRVCVCLLNGRGGASLG